MTMLLLAYILNFVDRQIIGALAVPIKADLGLTDAQLGLMGGLAFALFYTGFGIPVAMLADRSDRSRIMAVALLLWSAMTAICGLANSFWQLFLARLGVGVGEAGGAAPAYSLICDAFPEERRARALAIYSFGIPIGTASGIVLGGVIATAVSWRFAFIAVGLFGVVLSPLFYMLVKDPRRKGQLSSHQPAPLLPAIATLVAKPAFWLLSLGAASASVCAYGQMFWIPSFLVRSFDISLRDASLCYGAVFLAAGMAGCWLGGALADLLARRTRRAYALIPAVAFLITVPLFGAAILSQTLVWALVLLSVPIALGIIWLPPVITALQGLVPPAMRSTASACLLFVVNLFGIGLGAPVMGWLSDQLRHTYGADALRYSILSGTVFYVIGAAFLLLAARRVERDWFSPGEAGVADACSPAAR